MRWIVFALAVMALAVGLALYAQDDPGYVLITRGTWSVETSLVILGAVVLLAFTAFYVALRLVAGTWRSPRAVARWRRRQKAAKARQSQAQGLLQLVQGNWETGQNELLARLGSCDTPLINYLGAAVAAQRRGDTEARETFLALAHKEAPSETLSVGLVQARLQREAGQNEQALATLTRLFNEAPRNREVLRLMTDTYRDLNDWNGLASLLPSLRKHAELGDEQITELERSVHARLLGVSSSEDSGAAVTRTWEEKLPKNLRKDPALIAVYAQRLISLGEGEACEPLLRAAVKRSHDPSLVRLYGLAVGPNPAEQLKRAEEWLKSQPDSPETLLTAGRLAMRNEIWGKARSYLENAIANGAAPEAYAELGHLLEQLGEHEAAREVYRKGLRSLLPHDSRPPIPRAAPARIA
jgi:HemY protein